MFLIAHGKYLDISYPSIPLPSTIHLNYKIEEAEFMDQH